MVEPTVPPEFVYRHAVDTRTDVYLTRVLLSVLYRRLADSPERAAELIEECCTETERQVPPPRDDPLAADMRSTIKARVTAFFDRL